MCCGFRTTRGENTLNYNLSKGIALAMLLGMTTIVSAEEIVAATDAGYAPFTVIEANGDYTGIDMDIAKALSEELGVEIRVIDQPWSSTFPGLAAGKYDMVLAPAVINAERAESAMFTEPYADAPFGFLVRASGPTINDLEDLRGKTLLPVGQPRATRCLPWRPTKSMRRPIWAMP
jgi:ABC-type amino acid transport substrate-binding protein